jgi:long-chain acyl-CoA synthetase
VLQDDDVALRSGTTTLTKCEVADLLNRATNGLLAIDLGPQRRVAVFAENAPETVMAYSAAMTAGCSIVPISFHLTADEVTYILKDSGARVLFCGPETVERALEASASTDVGMLIGWRCDGSSSIAWEQWLTQHSGEVPRRDLVPLPGLSYTSGTTGFPKGVEQPPTIFVGGADISEFLERLAADKWNVFQRHLLIGPLYHTGPQSAVRALTVGHFVSVLGRFDPEETLQAIERDRPDIIIVVPSHLSRLLSLPEDVRNRHDVSSLKMLAMTGAACPVAVKEKSIEWFGPIIFEAYGATESGIVAAIDSTEWLAHKGSVGRPLPQFEVVVLDEDDRPAPRGTEGRLYFRDATGRGIIYHNDPVKTEGVHAEPGTFTLGEVGYLDEDGYLFITDRFSDMVVSGGVNIYPAESERVLLDHPAVADAVAIGVPNEDLGEEVKALVVIRSGASPSAEELITFCRDRLAHFKCPRSVDFVPAIARDPMGKVRKRDLRAPFWPDTRTIG